MRKKIFPFLLSILLLLTSFALPVQAEQITEVMIPYLHVTTINGITKEKKTAIKYCNGLPAYCIEILKITKTDADVYGTSSLETWGNLSQEDREKISAIASFSFPYKGRSELYYCAGQDLIWEITDPQNYERMTWTDTSGNDIQPQIENAKREIMEDVNSFLYTPSFTVNGQSVNDVVEVYVGQQVTFTDINGNLSLSAVSQNDFGNDVTIQGNDVTVTVTDYGEKTMVFSNKANNGVASAPFVLTNDEYQDLVVMGSATSRPTTIKVKGIGSTITIEKKKDDGNFLPGAVLELRDLTCNTAITFTSDGSPWSLKGCHESHEYQLKELSVPRGYYFAPPSAIIIPKENTTISMVDEKINMEVIKTNELGKPVTGAKLYLYDESGVEIANWTTTGEPMAIGDYVDAGKSYTLVEKDASDMYWLTSVEFEVPSIGSSTPVMIDFVNEHISYEFDKQDEEGNSLAGVTLALYDHNEDDREVLRWITSGSPMKVNTLKRGHTYTLKELEAPNGYYLAEDMVFTVEDSVPENALVKVVMEDKKIQLSITKVDEEGNPVSNAHLRLLDKENNIIDEWITDGNAHLLASSQLLPGQTYYLEEVEAPRGYLKAEVKEIMIPEEAVEVIEVEMKDAPIQYEVIKVDENDQPLLNAKLTLKDEEGNILHTWYTSKEAEDISSYLKENSVYSLLEEDAPAGYYLAEELSFAVENKEKTTVTLKNEPIDIDVIKLDERGEMIAGVTLELLDVEKNQVLDSWISEDTPHSIGHLVTHGKTYKIVETEWINGVHQASEKIFRVTDNASPHIVITMVDQDVNLSFLKTDEAGNPLEGAKLAIIEQGKDGDEVTIATFLSTKDTKGVSVDEEGRGIRSLLKGGSTYILRELEAPFGFQCAEDVFFTVSGTNEEKQCVTMSDERKVVKITLHKVSSKDSSHVLSGAEFEIVQKDTQNVVYTGTTNEDGNLTVELPYWFAGYEIKETKAPAGYQKTDEIFEFVLDDGFDFEQNTPIVLSIPNKPDNPNTGDPGYYIPLMVFVTSLIAGCSLILVKGYFRT